MNSITKSATNRKSSLVITAYHTEPGMPLSVVITVDGKESHYWTEIIPSDFGTAIRFSKAWDGKTRDFSTEEYDALLDGSHSSCECKGFLHFGYCRHVTAAIQLLSEGKLQPAPSPHHAPEKPAKQPTVWYERCQDRGCSDCSI